MTKREFIEKLLHERDKFELLLNRIGFTRRMTLKGVVGNWSIKDIIAHIWAYEQYIADRLHEIAHGEPYAPCKTHNALEAFADHFGYPDFGSPLLDDDAPNAWIYEKFKNVSLEEIVAQELQAFTSIVAALEGMSEETLAHHNLYARVSDNTYHHYRDHTRDIKAWLKTTAVNPKKS
jgi:Protein of unknown function (DUF1706)